MCPGSPPGVGMNRATVARPLRADTAEHLVTCGIWLWRSGDRTLPGPGVTRREEGLGRLARTPDLVVGGAGTAEEGGDGSGRTCHDVGARYLGLGTRGDDASCRRKAVRDDRGARVAQSCHGVAPDAGGCGG